ELATRLHPGLQSARIVPAGRPAGARPLDGRRGRARRPARASPWPDPVRRIRADHRCDAARRAQSRWHRLEREPALLEPGANQPGRGLEHTRRGRMGDRIAPWQPQPVVGQRRAHGGGPGQAAADRPPASGQPVRHRFLHGLRTAMHPDRLSGACAATQRSGAGQRMKRLCLLACLGAQAALASGLDDYANVMPILTSGESAAWQVDLDFSVYAGSIDPDLRDLAVFNADGQPVPMRMVAVAAPASLLEEQAGVALLALPADGDERARGDNLRLLVERDAEGRLRRLETQSSADTGADAEPNVRMWLLDLAGFKRGIDHLALDWDAPRDGVIAHFEVSASSDLQRWEMLNADATVVLLAQDATRIER